MAAIGFGVSAIGQAAGYAQSQQDTDNYNAQAKQNAINASVAASNKYADAGRQYAYDVMHTQQEGYNQAMKARQAHGSAVASAGSSGFEGATVNDVLNDIDQQEAINEANSQTKIDDKKQAYQGQVQSYEAEAQNRINSMPLKSDPSPLGAILGIATAGLDATSKTSWGKEHLGISTDA